MKILFSKEMYSEMEKAFGKKDLSKLHQKLITDKNGHQRKVWVKGDEVPKGQKPAKQEEEQKAKTKTAEPENSYAGSIARGDTITFATSDGNEVSGAEVKTKGKDGVTVQKDGVAYQVKWSDIKKVDTEASKSAVRDLFDIAKIKGGWRGTDGLQPESCDTMDGLWKAAAEAQADFAAKDEAVVEKFKELNPILLKRSELKGRERAMEKLRADEMEEQAKGNVGTIYDEKTDTYHCRTLRDVDGHTFCVKDINGIAKLLNHFDGDKDIVRIKNNFAKPSPVGYSDINMNIKLPNGTIAEIQLNTMANMVAKENYGHALYEVFRSLNRTEHQELADIMADAQKTLYGMANEYSKNGDFPDSITNPFGASHKPYEAAIKPFAEKAKELYNKAVSSGALNEKTVEHYNKLMQKLGL